MSEARVGPWIVRPAAGVLPGRGLGMPARQKITVTFAPQAAEAFEQRFVFLVQRGRPCSLSVAGAGSVDEVEEHHAKLFGI